MSAIRAFKDQIAHNRSVHQSKQMVRCARDVVDASWQSRVFIPADAMLLSLVPSAVTPSATTPARITVPAPARLVSMLAVYAMKVGMDRIVIVLVIVIRLIASVAVLVSLV